MMYATKDFIAACQRLTRERFDRWLEAGWITPDPSAQDKQQFTDLDRARADLICHLLDDLDVAEDTMPVVLSLMDQVYSLRRDMRALVKAIAEQPPSVRTEISIALRREHSEAD